MTFSDTRKLNQIKDSVRALYTQAYSVQNPSTKTIKKVSPSADLRTKKGWAHIESELDMIVERQAITARVHEEDTAADDDTGFWGDLEIIDAYTRADAVTDGLQYNLSDLFPQEAKEAGMVWPVYCDRSFWWHMFKEPCEAEIHMNDEKGVAWDIFGQLRRAIKRADRNSDRITVTVVVTGSELDPAYTMDRMPHYIFEAEIQGHDIDKPEPILMLTLPDQAEARRAQLQARRRPLAA